MSKGLFIFGNNNLAKLMVKYILKYTDYDLLGFCVNKEYLENDTFEGYSNIAFEDLDSMYSVDEIEILICIGNNKMNDIRKTVYEMVKMNGYKIAKFIHPRANLETDVIGEGTIILENTNIGMGVSLGTCNVIWNGCNISHDVKIGDFNYLAPSVAMAGNVNVEDNCFFGIGSVVRSAVSVASYTFLGAGCYLNNSTESEDVYVPQRAVKLSYRSKDMPIN